MDAHQLHGADVEEGVMSYSFERPFTDDERLRMAAGICHLNHTHAAEDLHAHAHEALRKAMKCLSEEGVPALDGRSGARPCAADWDAITEFFIRGTAEQELSAELIAVGHK